MAMCRIKYKNIWPLGQANNSNILSILCGVRKLPFDNKSKFSANFMGFESPNFVIAFFL